MPSNRPSSSIWPRNGTLIVTTTPGQSELENYGNEGILHIPKIQTLEPHHQMQSFQIFLSNTNNSIQHYSFIYT